MKDSPNPYCFGVAAAGGVTVVLLAAFVFTCFLAAFFVLVAAGVDVVWPLGAGVLAASIATADNRVAPINFFI